jgi:hypothetical protein
MRCTALLFLTLCAPLFSQTAPGNAAAENMQNRLRTLNLRARQPRGDSMVLLLNRPAPVCAIPLLNVIPSGNYRMPMIKPPAEPRDPAVQVPAPACDSKLFQNK